MNITITFDITQRLCAAIRAIVDAERPRVQALAVQDSEPESAVESTEPEKATEAQAEAEEPKKRKSRAKKAPSESNTPVTPAIGDNLSPACACAAPGPSAPEETPAEPEPAPAVADPSPVEGAVSFACVSYVGDRISETPAPEPAHGPAPAPEKDMSGKGEKGEILSDLTRRALAELDEAGVARDESNRRIRDYGIRHGLKFPSFTALVQILGYADAVAVAKGEIDE